MVRFDYKLQVKIPNRMRLRFQEAARGDGRSMSEVVRALIEDWIRQEQERESGRPAAR